MGLSKSDILVLISICISVHTWAQQNYNPFQYGNNPTYPSSQGTTPQNVNNNINRGLLPPQSLQYSNGNSAQDIIAKQNAQAMQMMNAPNLPPKNPSVYQQTETEQMKRYREVQTMLNELDQKTSWYQQPTTNNNTLSSTSFSAKQKAFQDAYQKLKNMLSGKQKLSIADAYYISESVVSSDYFSSSTQYKSVIKKSVDFIKQWMKANNYSLTNRDQVHLAIQKFMSEKLTTTIKTGTIETGLSFKTITHLPFFYDFNDYKAEQDNRNSYATKCWATGSGQCASMPVVYLCLAEGLGLKKTYLTYAPYHSFIKYVDQSGKVQNYEPTSNWKITDTWYQQNMFISSKAKATGIYLDTINNKQIVANCMVDLALSYMRTLKDPDDSFVMKCLFDANTFFPQENNLETYLVYQEYLANKLMKVLKKNNATKDQIAQILEALSLFREMVSNEEHIKKLGYQEIPKDMYEQMLDEQAMKGKIQIVKGIDGKKKRNLFTQTQ